jgi:U3 small nucleolar RNA-associated protein 25
MGKPGGFFKKLKRRQFKQAAKKSRGTEGASKADRTRKHNEAVDYYAAQRLADQLGNISDSSSEYESSNEDDDPALAKLRTALGVAPSGENEEWSDELPTDSDEEADEELDEEALLEDEELGEEDLDDDEEGLDDELLEEDMDDDGLAEAEDDEEGEEGEEGAEEDMEDAYEADKTLEAADRRLLLAPYKLSGASSAATHSTDPYYAKYHKDSHGLPDESSCTVLQKSVPGIAVTMSTHAEKIFAKLRKHSHSTRPPFVHDALWDMWTKYRTAQSRDILTQGERQYFTYLQQYSDLLDTTRTYDSAPSKIEVIVLHMLNHWFKGTAITTANDDISKKTDDGDDQQLRDQGFGKTRMMLVLPLRNSAKRFVEILREVMGIPAASCHKMSNFIKDFSELEDNIDPRFKRRPLDYRRQFDGNIDDSFCFGIRLQPTKFQLYSNTLNSDLIICSPIGLQNRMTRNGDITVALSSIEVCVIDEAQVLMMQNWAQLTSLMALLNKRPKDTTRGLNSLNRVYAWALEGKSGRHRQTIVVSEVSHACISTLLRESKNNSGKVQIRLETDPGVLSQIMLPLRQHFLRFDPASIETVDTDRYDYFVNDVMKHKLYPLMERGVRTILYVPSYFDFVRVRKFLHREYREFYTAISEYSSQREMRQALGQFTDGEKTLLVLTERFYFFKRYFVKQAEVLACYAPPVFPRFYSHLVGKLNLTPNSCTFNIFCRYDTHELTRLCGTDRTAQLLTRDSSAFSFVTQ